MPYLPCQLACSRAVFDNSNDPFCTRGENQKGGILDPGGGGVLLQLSASVWQGEIHCPLRTVHPADIVLRSQNVGYAMP